MYSWNSWLESPILLDSESGEIFTVKEWAESLVYEGILPHFEKVGYLIAGNKPQLVETVLNYLYRFEWDFFKKGKIYCCYTNKHGYSMTYTQDDLEYYHTVKCPPYVWLRIRRQVRAPFYADDSEFAEALWNDLPSMLFFTINLKESSASDDLKEHLKWVDDEDEDEEKKEDTRKKDIDPYLLDYGGPKYKKYD